MSYVQSCESVGIIAGQSADRALWQLLSTLQDVMEWEAKVVQCKELLQMLEHKNDIRKQMESSLDFR